MPRFFRGEPTPVFCFYCSVPVSKQWWKPYCFASREFVLYWCKISPAPCRERACPFRLPRFCRHPPVVLTQQAHRHNVNALLKKRIYPFRFFSGALLLLRIHLLRYPGIETLVETVVASHYVSAVFSFLPHSIGSPVKGSRQLAAEGLTAINYQLLALRCGQRSLVGNGLARSACYVHLRS